VTAHDDLVEKIKVGGWVVNGRYEEVADEIVNAIRNEYADELADMVMNDTTVPTIPVVGNRMAPVELIADLIRKTKTEGT
jgi:hypothetical protein